MFGLYTPVLILQAFCVYHAYRNNAEYRWYWFILLFPVIGCGFYMYHHFYSRTNINSIAEGVKVVVNSNYKLEQLEKAFKFSDNFTNRVNLADAYAKFGRYDEAIVLYKDALSGFMADDPGIRMRLLHTYFLSEQYSEAVLIGNDLESEKSFVQAEHRLAYAWALHNIGKTQAAEGIFLSLDKSFTNYKHRTEYCKFLWETGRVEEMKVRTADLLAEFEHMQGPERKLYRHIIQEIRALHVAQPAKL